MNASGRATTPTRVYLADAGWTLARILRSPDFRWPATGPDDWRRPWPDWPGTRYEAKALREGRPASYLTFIRA